MRYYCAVFFGNISGRSNVVFGYYKNMCGSLRFKVIKCNNCFILVNFCCRDFTVCNFADFFIVGGAIFLILSLLFLDRDAMFPVGKYKALAKEQEALDQEKKAQKENEKKDG